MYEMDKQIKSLLLLTLLQQVYFYFSFHLPVIQLLISKWKKSYEDRCHSPPHVSVTGNVLITIKRFACYHLLLASNITFMIASLYLGTIHIWQNLNENYYYLTSTKSMI